MSGGLFDLFQMSQENVLELSVEDSDSECYDTVEAGSSADEIDDCLSVVSEVEGLAVAEATGPKISKVPAGAKAQGSDELMESPGRKARRKKNKGRSQYGAGRAEHRKRQAISRQESKRGGGVYAGKSRRGTGVMEGCGSLTCEDTVCRHTSPRFSGTWVTRGRILGGSGRLHCRRS